VVCLLPSSCPTWQHDHRAGAGSHAGQQLFAGVLASSTCTSRRGAALQGHRTVVAADMEELPEGLAEDAAEHRETWT
jgi:hypothetical protein